MKEEKKIIELELDEVFFIVLKPLKFTFAICFIVLIAFSTFGALKGTALKNGNEFNAIFCKLNTCTLPSSGFIIYTAILIILALVIMIFELIKIQNIKLKFSVLILLSLLIMFSLVYLTGGILDSPFTGAVGVYVTSYFIIQERKDLKKVNRAVLLFVIILTIFPYALFMLNPDCTEKNILRWSSDQGTNILRLILTILLTSFAGYFGDRVNKELTLAFNEKNKLNKDGN